MDQGLIHIYCGEGKGKTTAAFGLALRCAGRGYRVLIVQFMKNHQTGEVLALKDVPGIMHYKGKPIQGFSYQFTPEQKKAYTKIHNENLSEVIRLCESENIDLLILDEILSAYNLECVDQQKVIQFLENKPKGLEVVITGRDPQPELVQLADYVSEINKIKHPFDKGYKGRKGIEW